MAGDILAYADFFFVPDDKLVYDEKDFQKRVAPEASRALLAKLKDKLAAQVAAAGVQVLYNTRVTALIAVTFCEAPVVAHCIRLVPAAVKTDVPLAEKRTAGAVVAFSPSCTGSASPGAFAIQAPPSLALHAMSALSGEKASERTASVLLFSNAWSGFAVAIS